MESIGDTALVLSHTTYLDAVLGIGHATISKRRTEHANDMIASGDDEISNQPFVSINYKISSEFGGLFVFSDQSRGR